MQNLELKVRVRDLSALRRRARALGARLKERMRQTDTYFPHPAGRLKVREINGKRAEAIFYLRQNIIGSKVSHFTVVPLTASAGRILIAAFTKLFGVWVVIHKQRELWLYRHTRIHLDTVRQLGTFLELETMLTGISPAVGRKEHQEVIQRLGLRPFPIIAGSYSDLLSSRRQP